MTGIVRCAAHRRSAKLIGVLVFTTPEVILYLNDYSYLIVNIHS